MPYHPIALIHSPNQTPYALENACPRWRRFSTCLLIGGLLLSPAGFVGATNQQIAVRSTLGNIGTLPTRRLYRTNPAAGQGLNARVAPKAH